MLGIHETLRRVNFLPVPGTTFLVCSRQFLCLLRRTKGCPWPSRPWFIFSRFVVHGLTTGEQYIFRVKAVNAVGTSENSQESDVIKVQAALSKCFSGRSAPAPGSPLRLHFCRSQLLWCRLEHYTWGSVDVNCWAEKHAVTWSPLINWLLVLQMPGWQGEMIICVKNRKCY